MICRLDLRAGGGGCNARTYVYLSMMSFSFSCSFPLRLLLRCGALYDIQLHFIALHCTFVSPTCHEPFAAT